MPDLASVKRFQFIGGNLSLDFCNTMGGKRGTGAKDHLKSCLDFVGWCQQGGVIDSEQSERLAEEAEHHPEEAALALQQAIAFRETLFRVFAAMIEAGKPAPADLARLNAELSKSLGHLRVILTGGANQFDWRWSVEGWEWEQLLGPIAHAAAKLLTDPAELAHLRMCNGDNCGWLFIDSSKNHSRRWCDMRDCGNRAKIRRHRLKQQHLHRDV